MTLILIGRFLLLAYRSTSLLLITNLIGRLQENNEVMSVNPDHFIVPINLTLLSGTTRK